MLLIDSVVRAQTAAIRAEERSPTTVADLLKPETSPSVRDCPSGPPSEVEGATRPGHLDCRSFARPRKVADVIMAAAGHKAGDAASGSVLECDELDRKLIDSIAHGDHTAIRELHRRYYHRIASFVRAVTYRSDFIDEVANDTLWVVWQCAARFRGESKVSTWIMGIARNLSFKAIRAMRRSCHNVSDALGEQAYEASSQSDLTEWVDKALARLPFEQRTVLEMFYRLEQSCEEISQALNCPINTVKTRMFNGRRRLRELLPRLGGVAEST